MDAIWEMDEIFFCHFLKTYPLHLFDKSYVTNTHHKINRKVCMWHNYTMYVIERSTNDAPTLKMQQSTNTYLEKMPVPDSLKGCKNSKQYNTQSSRSKSRHAIIPKLRIYWHAFQAAWQSTSSFTPTNLTSTDTGSQ